MRRIIRTLLALTLVVGLGGCTFRTHYSGHYGYSGYGSGWSHCDPWWGGWSIGYSTKYDGKHHRGHRSGKRGGGGRRH
jgi:hypothetical protein